MSTVDLVTRAVARNRVSLSGTEAQQLEAALTVTEQALDALDARLRETLAELAKTKDDLAVAARDRDLLLQRVARLEIARFLGGIGGDA